MAHPTLTLALVSNRPHHLKTCLASLTTLKTTPAIIHILDTSPTGTAAKLATHFRSALPLTHTLLPSVSVAAARNYALTHTSTSFLGFIDDDCVVDPDWHPHTLPADSAYFVGRSTLANPASLVAQAQYLRHLYWFHQKLRDGQTHPFNVDTKNIILNLTRIKSLKLRFSDNYQIGSYDGSDTDFGFRLHTAGLTGTYLPGMKVAHAEVEALKPMLRKAYIKGRLGCRLHYAWDLKGELVNLQYRTFLPWFTHACLHAPQESGAYFRASTLPPVNRIPAYSLIKLYDYWYLKGFLSESNHPSAN